METLDLHVTKAQHNAAFLSTLNLTDDRYADWAIVALFYTALHLVRAVLHHHSTDHGTSHPKTQHSVNAIYPPDAAMSYERLYSRSRLVRYDILLATLNDFQKLRDADFTAVAEASRNLAGLTV